MAKPKYKVWVVNLVSLGTKVENPNDSNYYFTWDQSTLDDTVAKLKTIFDEVCKSSLSHFSEADVDSEDLTTVNTSAKPSDLVIRLTTKTDSILIKKYGASAVANDTSGATKDTGSGVVSEAWIEGAAGSATVAALLARLAFHELMHNKIDATNSKDIHSAPDDGTGLAVSPVSYNTALTDTNKRNLANRLHSVVSQFTGATIP